MHRDEAEVRPALEHDAARRYRLPQQPHEGLLATVLHQLTDVVQVRELCAGEPDAVHVELEALERARDQRRQPVDEKSEPQSACQACDPLEQGQCGELGSHAPRATLPDTLGAA